MAISDKLALFAEGFDLDQETGTYVLTDVYDMKAAAMDPGNGEPLYVNITVGEAFTDGSDGATLEIQIVSDDNTSLSSPTVHLSSGTFLKAALTIGKRMSFALPAAGKAYERYLGVRTLVGTAGFDSGEITAWLALEPIANIKTYPDGAH